MNFNRKTDLNPIFRLALDQCDIKTCLRMQLETHEFSLLEHNFWIKRAYHFFIVIEQYHEKYTNFRFISN